MEPFYKSVCRKKEMDDESKVYIRDMEQGVMELA
jgi:hypothetical protein